MSDKLLSDEEALEIGKQILKEDPNNKIVKQNFDLFHKDLKGKLY